MSLICYFLKLNYYDYKMVNQPLETRPIGVTATHWKNRFLVSSKLTPSNHKKFIDWCKANNYSYSSGINYLIENYLN